MILPGWAWAPGGAVLGAIFGSFLATLLVRWPRGERAAAGRSHCDQCGRVLGPGELVPVLSHLVQRGRCRGCGAAIGREHLWIELAAAAIGVLAFGAVQDVAGGLAWAAFGWLLLTLAWFDWRHLWLPDALTLPLAALGLLLGPFATEAAIADRLAGGAAGWASLAAIAAGYRALRGRDGLGGGDPKLFGAIGLWLGWLPLPFVLTIASLFGLVLALTAAATGRGVARDTRLPLGTFLCLAAVPGWLAVRLLAG